jgi:2-phosphosulfolactate phosphatase
MVRELRVHLVPALFEPEELRGGVAVLIDVLRASTTIIHALAHGADAVIPRLTPEAGREAAAVLQKESRPVLLGGERDGVLIPGYDLDNNPFAYTADAVQGKTVVFTTTNGTRALHKVARAGRVLIGAFVNLSALVRVLEHGHAPIHLICAGTRGAISTEDILCAGAIVDQLAQTLKVAPADWTDDSLQIAWRLYASVKDDPQALGDAIRASYGGRNCRRLGFDDQIDFAARFDVFDFAPEYDHRLGRIVRV